MRCVSSRNSERLRGGLPATTARRDGDGWRISGHKLFSTGSPILSYMIVWGRTEGDDPLVGYFLVPADSPGIRIEETWNHAGMRASGSHDVILTDVAIPFDHAVDLRRPEEWNEDSSLQTAWMVGLLGNLYDAVAHQGVTGSLSLRAPGYLAIWAHRSRRFIGIRNCWAASMLYYSTTGYCCRT